MLQQQIAATDVPIDRLAYDLYALMPKVIVKVETDYLPAGASGVRRQTGPRGLCQASVR